MLTALSPVTTIPAAARGLPSRALVGQTQLSANMTRTVSIRGTGILVEDLEPILHLEGANRDPESSTRVFSNLIDRRTNYK